MNYNFDVRRVKQILISQKGKPKKRGTVDLLSTLMFKNFKDSGIKTIFRDRFKKKDLMSNSYKLKAVKSSEIDSIDKIRYNTYFEHVTSLLIKSGGGLERKNLKSRTTLRNIIEGKEFFKKNANCRFIGIWPLGHSETKSKRIPYNQYLVEYAQKAVRDENYFNFQKKPSDYHDIVKSELINYREVWSSGHDSILPLTQKMAGYTGVTNMDELREIVSLMNPEFMRLPRVELPDKKAITITINPESSPGPVTKVLVGKTRIESCYLTIVVSEILLRMLSEVGFGYSGVWDLLGREKDIKVDNLSEGEYASTRQVLNPDEPFMFLGQHILQPMTNAIILDNRSRISIGKELQSKYGDYIVQKFGEYDRVVELDWPTYDIYVDYNEIIMACVILMNNYKCHNSSDEVRRRNYTRFITSFAVNKSIIMPDRTIFKINNGLPSGFPGTSIVGSVINLIRIARIGKYIYGDNFQEHMEVFVQGDDALIFMKDARDLEKGIRDACNKVLYKKIDDIKIYNTNTHFMPNESPNYLKRHLYGSGIIGWDIRKTLRKILYPKRSRELFLENFYLIYNYQLTAMGDYSFNEYLDKYIEYMRQEIVNPFSNSDIDTLRGTNFESIRYKLELVSKSTLTKLPISDALSSKVMRRYSIDCVENMRALILTLLRVYMNDHLIAKLLKTFHIFESVCLKYFNQFKHQS